MWDRETSERAWKAFLYGIAAGLFAIGFVRSRKLAVSIASVGKNGGA